MAIWYVDPYNGDDGNNGTSWSQAWKQVGGHQLSISDNDEVRYAKTPDPINIGSATYTDKGTTIIFSNNNRTKTIENAIGNTWVGCPNITMGTNSNRKIGANCQQIQITGAFTSGKIAYKTLPESLNLSTYSILSFWIGCTNVGTMNNKGLKICLCSDSIGDVIVNTFYVPTFYVSNRHQSMFIDLGIALGDNINSIAIYIEVDIGTTATSVFFNNIIACKPNDISHRAVIGKDNQLNTEFWAIGAIDGDTIYLDPQFTSKGYSGTSETVDSYIRDTCAKADTYAVTLVKNFTFATMIHISGGWNMLSDEQDGETWLNGLGHGINGIHNQGLYIKYSNFRFVNYSVGVNFTAKIAIIENVMTINSGSGFVLFGTSITKNIKVLGVSGLGIDGQYVNIHVENATLRSCVSYAINNYSCFCSTFKNITVYNSNYIWNQAANCIFENITVHDIVSNNLFLDSIGGSLIINLNRGNQGGTGKIITHNSCIRNTPIELLGNSCYNVTWINEITNEKRTIQEGYTSDASAGMIWQTTYKMENRNGCWKLRLEGVTLNNQLGYYNLSRTFKIADIDVVGNQEVTVTLYVMVISNNLGCSWRVYADKLYSTAIKSEPYVDIQDSNLSSNVFTPITLTFTPDNSGIAVIKIKRIDGTNISDLYIGDVTAV